MDSDNNAVEATAAFTASGITLSYTKAVSANDIAFGMAWGDAAGGYVPYPRYALSGGMQTMNGGV